MRDGTVTSKRSVKITVSITEYDRDARNGDESLPASVPDRRRCGRAVTVTRLDVETVAE
ncbi:hypothetical protein [Halorientalis pallida]|uniref:hypothetical protein n=1 Tax=Halorientalis pallida TaxID=2479928 RepID=UPI00187D3FE2|nr:hypothetical protein [Halorientalis pallida]